MIFFNLILKLLRFLMKHRKKLFCRDHVDDVPAKAEKSSTQAQVKSSRFRLNGATIQMFL